MAIITKSDAEIIAQKLTVKYKKALTEAETELRDLGFFIAKKDIKNEILEMFEKHPNYFNKASTLYVNGRGLNHDEINLVNFQFHTTTTIQKQLFVATPWLKK